MNLLYFGKICDLDIFEKKEQKEQPYFIAQYMFEKALYDQFYKDDSIEVDVVSIYQTEYFPNENIFFSKKESDKNFTYIPFINIPFFRELSYFFMACFYILKWFIINKKSKDIIIYSSCHFPPVSAAIVLMGQILSVKKVVTFTDLPLFTYSKKRIKKMKFYKKLIIRPYLKLVMYLQKSYDYYILFSHEMNAEVNVLNKPSIVIEGIYNADNLDLTPKSKKKAIAHAGTLNKEVGIDKILEVFNQIKDNTIELWLIGKGDMVDEIIAQSKIDNRIKYLGFMPREDVFNKLKEADLLINLRNPNDQYTKYSFPSKMFEYMASGTPVISTKITSIPDEYYNYIYTTDCYDNSIIANNIINLLLTNKNVLKRKGFDAQQFIISKKNAKSQKKKIINFLKDNNYN